MATIINSFPFVIICSYFPFDMERDNSLHAIQLVRDVTLVCLKEKKIDLNYNRKVDDLLNEIFNILRVCF